MPCTYPLERSVGGPETIRSETNVYTGRPGSVRQLLYAEVIIVERKF